MSILESPGSELFKSPGLELLDGSIELVTKLIANGYDVNYKDRHGFTALYVAVVKRRINIAHLLLKNGADVDIQYQAHCGMTVLMILIFYYCVVYEPGRGLVQELVKSSTNINATNHHSGYTALMYAVHHGYSEIVQDILDHGADVCVEDIGHHTAFYLARYKIKENPQRKEYPQILEKLVEHVMKNVPVSKDLWDLITDYL
jgi:ankyrin repeat protein